MAARFINLFGKGSAVAAGFVPNYFVSPSGLDTNDGRTLLTPWKTVAKVNASTFLPGDVIAFQGGQTFAEGLIVPSSGSVVARIAFTSYGVGRATFAPIGTVAGLQITDKEYLTFDNINLSGTGASTGNAFDLSANTATRHNVTLQNFTASGFSTGGAFIGGDTGTAGWANVTVQNFTMSNNAKELGVYGSGGLGVKVNSNITIQNGTVSGCGRNGTYIGNAQGGLFKNIVAFGNGATGTAGPVGVWTFESDSVVIQFSESYDNTSANTIDGDGFDIDEGCTNCIIEYCYSHDNVGAGYLLASHTLPFSGNTIRYCIGQNNGRAGQDTAGELVIFQAPSETTSGGMVNVSAYGNTFFNNLNIGAVVSTQPGTLVTGRIANNIFYSSANTPLISVPDNDAAGLLFTGNDYFASGTFSISWNGTNYSSLAAWQTATGQEKIAGVNVGFSVDPQLHAPGSGGTIGPPGYAPPLPLAYDLIVGSPMIGAGLDIKAQFGIDPGAQDYYGNPNPRSGVFPVGAYGGIGVAPVLWTPLNLGAALVAWWDAQDTAHIALSGSNVTSWTDKVGGIVASQSTGANQPTWSATARNGKPGLTFNGTSSALLFTPSASFPSGDAVGTFFGFAFNNAATNTFLMEYGTHAGGLGRFYLVDGSAFALVTDASFITSSGVNTSGIDFSFTGTCGAESGLAEVNGNAPVTGAWGATNTGLTGGSIGADIPLDGNFWSGVIQDEMIITGALSASNRAKLDGWASWKNGLAGSNLPIGSPYKSRPPFVSDP